MSMNDFLAQMYGTNEIEKTAQSRMLEKMANAEGIDLSGLTPEQLDLLAQQIAMQEQASVAQPQPQMGMPAPEAQMPMEEQEKLAQAKFAEADFLGRVMAHSFHQEMSKIAEEQCGDCGKPQAACECPPAATKEAGGPVASAIRALGGHIEGAPQQVPQGYAPQQVQAEPTEVEKLAYAIQMVREAGYRVG